MTCCRNAVQGNRKFVFLLLTLLRWFITDVSGFNIIAQKSSVSALLIDGVSCYTVACVADVPLQDCEIKTYYGNKVFIPIDNKLVIEKKYAYTGRSYEGKCSVEVYRNSATLIFSVFSCRGRTATSGWQWDVVTAYAGPEGKGPKVKSKMVIGNWDPVPDLEQLNGGKQGDPEPIQGIYQKPKKDPDQLSSEKNPEETNAEKSPDETNSDNPPDETNAGKQGDPEPIQGIYQKPKKKPDQLSAEKNPGETNGGKQGDPEPIQGIHQKPKKKPDQRRAEESPDETDAEEIPGETDGKETLVQLSGKQDIEPVDETPRCLIEHNPIYEESIYDIPATMGPSVLYVDQGVEVELTKETVLPITNCRFRWPGKDDNPNEWYSEGSEDDYTVVNKDLAEGKCSLQLRGLTGSSSGHYKVDLITERGRLLQTTTIIVKTPPNPPVLTLNKKDGVYNNSDFLQASCFVSPGRPVARIIWLLGDDVIRNDHFDDSSTEDDFKFAYDERCLTQFISLKLTRDDNGKELICRAEHIAWPGGRSDAKQRIFLTSPDTENSDILLHLIWFLIGLTSTSLCVAIVVASLIVFTYFTKTWCFEISEQ